MFENKHIMSMTPEELQNEIDATNKSIEHEEKMKSLKTMVILWSIAIVAVIAIAL